MHNKKSFFEKLTGTSNIEPEYQEDGMGLEEKLSEDNPEEGQLTLDIYQTPSDIVIQAFVAGLKADDLDISITHDMVVIKGKREDSRRVERENFFYQELYWGAFSRSMLLPQEVDPDEAEATIKNGMLTIKLPKLDKEKIQRLKVKAE